MGKKSKSKNSEMKQQSGHDKHHSAIASAPGTAVDTAVDAAEVAAVDAADDAADSITSTANDDGSLNLTCFNGFRVWLTGDSDSFDPPNGTILHTLDPETEALLRSLTVDRHTEIQEQWVWKYYVFTRCAVAIVQSSNTIELCDQIEFIERLMAENDGVVDMYVPLWPAVLRNDFKSLDLTPETELIMQICAKQDYKLRLMQPTLIRMLTPWGPLNLTPRPWITDDIAWDKFACSNKLNYFSWEKLFSESAEEDEKVLGSRFKPYFCHPKKGEQFNYNENDPFPPCTELMWETVDAENWKGRDLWDEYHWRMLIRVHVCVINDPLYKRAINFHRFLRHNVSLDDTRSWALGDTRPWVLHHDTFLGVQRPSCRTSNVKDWIFELLVLTVSELNYVWNELQKVPNDWTEINFTKLWPRVHGVYPWKLVLEEKSTNGTDC